MSDKPPRFLISFTFDDEYWFTVFVWIGKRIRHQWCIRRPFRIEWVG